MRYQTGIVTSAALGAIALLAAGAPPLRAADNLLPGPGRDWTTWSARAELAPQQDVVRVDGADCLRMRARGFASYGKWIARAPVVRPGGYYRLEALFRTRDVASEEVSVAFLVSWNSAANRPLQRDYVDSKSAAAGGWTRTARVVRAPENAASAAVELVLRWTASGSVLWRSASLVEVEAPAPRKARIVTTRIQPGRGATVEKNIQLMAETFDLAAAHKPDLVLFTENFVDRAVKAPLRETAQTVPGPATRMLSEKARQYKTWTATSLHERDGDLIYNTAVLIDREGRIAGKYRKVHLAMAEAENGITPGSEYPVFETDFGRVGMMVCWDNWFGESARMLRLNGAEVILLPIAGDGVPGHWDVISRARAIDNGVFLVASSTSPNSPSRIIDPDGKVLAETAAGVAWAEIDLSKETRVRSLSVGAAEGEGKSLYIKERRPDTYNRISAGSAAQSGR